ncbi:MAG: DUF302 domain-containing protein [Mariniphaga sp.]|nr:DUF302 domain-containing protein [Mariniphaga sp.]MDD4226377.1 DUF302 domain-containing protein [Mariniphaga sp.]
MNYYLSTVLKNRKFDEVIDLVKSELGKEGFGVPTEVDMQSIFSAKLGEDFRRYQILGACNPGYAKKAIESERNIGVLLPCSVVVQECDNGDIEVAAVDPLASMTSVGNSSVQEVATEITRRLQRVIKNLGISE